MTLSVTDCLLIALSGLFTVFMLLAFLSVVVLAISKIINRSSKQNTQAAPAQTQPANAPAMSDDGAWCGEVLLDGADEKTAA